MNAQVFFWQISGQSPFGIEDSAGGPGRLAKLLRRQWTKEEPWRMRLAWSLAKSARRGCFTIVVAYAALAILFFAGRPAITRNFTAEYNVARAMSVEAFMLNTRVTAY